MVKVCSCRSWDEVLFAKFMSQLEISSCDWICNCWKKLVRTISKSPFVELNSEGLRLHPVVEEYLHKNQPDSLCPERCGKILKHQY